MLELNPGDKVILVESWGGRKITTVKRVTAKQIFVQQGSLETAFWKKNGEEVTGDYRRCRIAAWTLEEEINIDERKKCQELKGKLQNALQGLRLDWLNSQQIQNILDVLEANKN